MDKKCVPSAQSTVTNYILLVWTRDLIFKRKPRVVWESRDDWHEWAKNIRNISTRKLSGKTLLKPHQQCVRASTSKRRIRIIIFYYFPKNWFTARFCRKKLQERRKLFPGIIVDIWHEMYTIYFLIITIKKKKTTKTTSLRTSTHESKPRRACIESSISISK